MPMGDLLFAQLPAKQDNLSLDAAREVEQADVDVFDLHAGRMNFRYRVLGTLYRTLAFGPATGYSHYIHEGATIQKYAMSEVLDFAVHFFDQFLAIDGSAQQ